MKTPTAILLGEKSGRYHPVVFRWSPSPVHTNRYKSVGHHTEGFETLDEAKKFCVDDEGRAEPVAVYNWNETDIPAMVLFGRWP